MHRRGNNSHPWNDLADLIAKKAVDEFITTGCGPFNIDKVDGDGDEGNQK